MVIIPRTRTVRGTKNDCVPRTIMGSHDSDLRYIIYLINCLLLSLALIDSTFLDVKGGENTRTTP